MGIASLVDNVNLLVTGRAIGKKTATMLGLFVFLLNCSVSC